MQAFVPRLKDHLLARIRDIPHSGDQMVFSQAEQDTVIISNDRVYTHKTFRINYTTYDVRRDYDIVKPTGPRQDIMVSISLDPEEDTSEVEAHPFWYARVLGVYHVNVLDSLKPTAGAKRMDVLFVRWFGEEPGWRSGWKARRLDRVGFVEASDPNAFGFVDPNNVVRGCHLIPTFVNGQTHRLLGPSSVARGKATDHTDWDTFYVMR